MERPKDGRYKRRLAVMDTDMCGYRRMEDFLQHGL
jgi:hypothetical protein